MLPSVHEDDGRLQVEVSAAAYFGDDVGDKVPNARPK
jgi:hypothetical protein